MKFVKKIVEMLRSFPLHSLVKSVAAKVESLRGFSLRGGTKSVAAKIESLRGLSLRQIAESAKQTIVIPPVLVKTTNALVSSTKALVAFPAGDGRNDTERAFLPAALEIVETPPSPVGRSIGAVIIALFSLALIWACLGKIDIVASAQGKIVPSGRTKVVQPFETGVVRAIHVQDGQAVKTGDLLIELDPTISEAEVQHSRGDRIGAELDVARLRAALVEDGDPVAAFQPPEGASDSLIATQRQFLTDQVSEHHAKLAALDGQLAQKEAERATITATIEKINAAIEVLDQRVEIRKVLLDKGLGSKVNYLEMLQLLVEQQKDLNVQQSRFHEAEAATAALVEARAQAEAEYRRTIFGELSTAAQKAAGFSQDLIRAEQRAKLQQLVAPVDGTVQQLVVHTVGGVVTPAQALLVVVPNDSQLEIEAMISNHDIGFVQVGDEAQIKVDTFNFTRYGLLHGRVLSVSQDAITRDKPANRSSNGVQSADNSSSEPSGQELLYSARISVDRTQMQIDEKRVNLSPGMAVTAEIKTGSRRVINYLLSPLIKYRDESLHER
jgi:hemolysin D